MTDADKPLTRAEQQAKKDADWLRALLPYLVGIVYVQDRNRIELIAHQIDCRRVSFAQTKRCYEAGLRKCQRMRATIDKLRVERTLLKRRRP